MRRFGKIGLLLLVLGVGLGFVPPHAGKVFADVPQLPGGIEEEPSGGCE